jgi:hypothetical protein
VPDHAREVTHLRLPAFAQRHSPAAPATVAWAGRHRAPHRLSRKQAAQLAGWTAAVFAAGVLVAVLTRFTVAVLSVSLPLAAVGALGAHLPHPRGRRDRL